MSQLPLSPSSARFWAGRVSALAFAGVVSLSGPVHAQVLGGLGQRPVGTTNAPQQSSAPQPQPAPRSFPQASLPRPAFPQPAPSNSAPVFSNNVRVYRSSPSENAPVMQRPIYPSAPVQQNEMPFQPLPPSITYRRVEPQQGGNFTRRTWTNENNSAAEPALRRAVGPRGTRDGNAPVFNDLGSIRTQERSIRVTTPVGARPLPRHDYDNYIYQPEIIAGGPTLLGGYYYGNYCDNYYPSESYPTVYGYYDGFPPYLYNPSVIVLGQPYYPVYATSYLPFFPPIYPVTYNQTNYYVGSPERVQQVEYGGEPARRALKNAYPEGSYQAAFGDVEKAWTDGDLSLIRRHIRDSDTKLSVYFKGKYSYSIASNDFLQITRDALGRLNTVSFQFTRLRKAKNGDVTAYGKHVYRTAGGTDAGGDQASAGDTVPFSTDGSQEGRPYAHSDDPASGMEKTVYISYTLRHQDDQWNIIGVDSSPTDLVK